MHECMHAREHGCKQELILGPFEYTVDMEIANEGTVPLLHCIYESVVNRISRESIKLEYVMILLNSPRYMNYIVNTLSRFVACSTNCR